MLQSPKEAVGAIATIVAAIVGGVVALLSLIISKEQKISEFRQQWIDALRVDISTLIVRHHALYLNRTSENVALKETQEDMSAANEAAARIRLRLNPNEGESEYLLRAVGHHFHVAQNGTKPNEITDATNHLVEVARVVLKKEWNVVRSGEPVFRIAKYVTVSMILVATSYVTCPPKTSPAEM
jgi:hypothetical protein